ncbi:hypothetical protein ACT3TY_17680 [Halomonas sp. AOP22-C1-8]|uniref:hypothetical protein n=1 Tax=Halomonas sp. AOP22-C1-8 TaxID=3457717 RepID=UPI004033BDCD
MTVYNISYDLKQPGQKYAGLIDEIKKSPGWLHCLESTWLISTTETAQRVHERLSTNLDSNDSLLIIEVVKNYQGLLTKDKWDWINKHVTRH